MIADLTVNSIVFAKSWDNESGSMRQSSARGVNTPDILSIKRQDSSNGRTGVAEKRHTVSFDRVCTDSVTGQTYTVRMYWVAVIPSLATSSDVTAIVATFRDHVAETTDGTIEEVLNNES